MARKKPEDTMLNFDYDRADAAVEGTREAWRKALRTGLRALRMRRRLGLAKDNTLLRGLEQAGQKAGRPIKF